MIKENNGRFITEMKEALRIWAANFKKLPNEQEQQVASSSRARLGERWKWRRWDRTKSRQGNRSRRNAVRQDGDGWRVWSQLDRKVTERVLCRREGYQRTGGWA